MSLEGRAALEGRSLSECALGELRRTLERPTRRQLIERVEAATASTGRRVGGRGGPGRTKRLLIVLDASAVVEWLLGLRLADAHRLGVEVAGALGATLLTLDAGLAAAGRPLV